MQFQNLMLWQVHYRLQIQNNTVDQLVMVITVTSAGRNVADAGVLYP